MGDSQACRGSREPLDVVPPPRNEASELSLVSSSMSCLSISLVHFFTFSKLSVLSLVCGILSPRECPTRSFGTSSEALRVGWRSVVDSLGVVLRLAGYLRLCCTPRYSSGRRQVVTALSVLWSPPHSGVFITVVTGPGGSPLSPRSEIPPPKSSKRALCPDI